MQGTRVWSPVRELRPPHATTRKRIVRSHENSIQPKVNKEFFKKTHSRGLVNKQKWQRLTTGQSSVARVFPDQQEREGQGPRVWEASVCHGLQNDRILYEGSSLTSFLYVL